ncbi:MAG TPA: hypothetical protein VNY31_01060 [Solirubrobacteraceae bacterium]|nr:hypothetical protein [Solirubrobacteraceae bacterium]
MVRAWLDDSRRVYDDRDVAVGGVLAPPCSVTLVPPVYTTPDLDDTPHVGVPRVAHRYPEVPRGVSRRIGG